ncbi:MAG: 16S rRNA (cytosine(1402)-N(4))-methyltransferase [Candidatus Zambryskibacteria bacterium RIFCSPLOWO2_02_FULL_51_21]|uniref:Ribosomal RNA small subunit methyltransferase H n=1 Tax=Candidatus Zambryskibacteria bacterium RIFCSPHIGHO2_02_FULL_43_37 TaxID=1802749 RepID=A0A1G2TH13_9BACT|nr:MAG: 16S rRNA (cytosine(1402)-N(4))-methyltransferase [Candidatus Zambryskibacteria bacterium RIFCSPHIGHO2_01_FULL_52_18]OHA96596.1 MAG: 16S rRNA (cytosine(1402)-N(4))-methyltransferase [Candidatus Zambryskibacteria bacterium RIFCSPHIGHO2_02_FULL_43_37]OHB07644.1 MAG: 16S rRNA (cytosine(1402)-N(4))-methyltransferase [Candidatus Zambryskibacteria bacterium RIFCSPLOWO2_01_FULL_52_12]OHB11140.1 MAG: 16S rRNA (cytosine(1402)-N(4))-methyltransferase [Candidatus Zambryskibacteria bacterium RIFCSPLO
MHKPVLLREVISNLNLKDGEVFVDATYGAGGHTKEVLKRFPGVKAISIDQDPETHADITGNFRDLDKLIGDTRPDAILLDIGLSSDQLENSGLPAGRQGRGFSFQRDEPLDMRMSGKGITAAEILNSWDEPAIELILRGFGEERFSRLIAKRIVERRQTKPFKTTFDLVDVIGGKRSKIHPATRTFQALRIATNEELAALEEGLEKAWQVLKPGGRILVISFHSLEDRIVKNFAKRVMGKARKPITPSDEEIGENPRSRSAKLRIIEKP